MLYLLGEGRYHLWKNESTNNGVKEIWKQNDITNLQDMASCKDVYMQAKWHF